MSETSTTTGSTSPSLSTPSPASSPSSRNSKGSIYCAGAAGGFIVAITDKMQNGEQALVSRFGEVIAELFDSVFFSENEIIPLVFVVGLAALACWIYEPHSKVEALTRGLSIFALFTLTPASSIDTPETIGANPPAAEQSDGLRPAAFVPMQLIPVQHRSVPVDTVELVVNLRPANDMGKAQWLVTLRDKETAELIYRRYWTGTKFKLAVPDSHRKLRVELDVPGHRRTSFEPKLQGGEGVNTLSIDLESSSIPLGLQQLVGYKNLGQKKAQTQRSTTRQQQNDGLL